MAITWVTGFLLLTLSQEIEMRSSLRLPLSFSLEDKALSVCRVNGVQTSELVGDQLNGST